jgi:hypothetical protein
MRQSASMVTRRDMCRADGGLKCLWRRNVVGIFANTGAQRTRHTHVLHGLNLRLDGHEHHRRGR